MAFKLSPGRSPFLKTGHGLPTPFKQENIEQKKPDFSALPTKDFRVVNVQSQPPKRKIARQEARKIANLGVEVTGTITSSKPGETYTSGSRIGALLGGNDYWREENPGRADAEVYQTGGALDNSQKRQLKKDIKKAILSGQGNVAINGTSVTTGAEVKKVESYNPKREAEQAYAQEQHNARITAAQAARAKHQEELKIKKAELQAKLEKQRSDSQAGRAQAEAERKKRIEEIQAKKNNKSEVLLQRKTPFYQTGMFEEKVIGKTSSSRRTTEGRPGTIFSETTNYQSDGGSGSSKTSSSGAKMGNKDWASFVKNNPDWEKKQKNRSETTERFVPDEEKPITLNPALVVKSKKPEITASAIIEPPKKAFKKPINISAGGKQVTTQEAVDYTNYTVNKAPAKICGCK
jgi:hypothetical protein